MNIHQDRSGYWRMRRRLLREVYGNDPYYKDSTTPLIRMLLSPSSAFAAEADVMPVVVTSDGHTPLACAVMIIARKMSDVLQVGFLEALPDRPEAVSGLMDHARTVARKRGVFRIVIGLNGHVNNGLGFLADGGNAPACFGSGYNPRHYIEELESITSSSSTLTSYLYDLSVAHMDREKRVLGRIARRFRVRTGNFADLRKEIAIYTHLNNACFRNHPLYYERSVDADYELFKSFGPFLKEENFLISEVDGEPIGFLLWYPDFHELIRPRGRIGLGTALRYRLPGNPITKFKIAEIGILPEYQGSAAIGGLIHRCFELSKSRGFSYCESGWIFDSNRKSKNICERWNGKPYKTYKFFELTLDGEQ